MPDEPRAPGSAAACAGSSMTNAKVPFGESLALRLYLCPFRVWKVLLRKPESKFFVRQFALAPSGLPSIAFCRRKMAGRPQSIPPNKQSVCLHSHDEYQNHSNVRDRQLEDFPLMLQFRSEVTNRSFWVPGTKFSHSHFLSVWSL